MELAPLNSGQGWAKVGFFGAPKSGKTWTGALLACGLRQHFGHDGPIVMFDTEGGSPYIADLVRRTSGTELVGVRSRAFDDLMATARECEKIGASVLLVDSITHPWREVCESYLARINTVLEARGREKRGRIELADWQPIKAKWAPWSDWYLNSKLHVIVCGRAGDIWTREENEDTGKLEMVKSGVKMKTEGEFAFEPSLLVLMEAVQPADARKKHIVHRATVIGDRFGVLDGEQCDNPDFSFFAPFVEALTPQAHSPVDVSTKTTHEITDGGDSAWNREKRDRAILAEEIQGELLDVWPGQSAADKKAKADVIYAVFQSRSWAYVESLRSESLRVGLAKIREITAAARASATGPTP